MPAFKGKFDFVIVGGGNAAGYAAKEYVSKGGPKGELLIITSEPYCSYERPTCSKAYMKLEGGARLPKFHTSVGGGGDLQDDQWYPKHGIQFMTNTEVTNIDFKKKQLSLANQPPVEYGKLLLCTGSTVADLKDMGTPGAELENIMYLRNVADADRILGRVKQLKTDGGKAVVIGGGYIGLEMTASLRSNGLDVTVVLPQEHFLSRMLTDEVGEFYESYYKEKGVTIRAKARAVSFEPKSPGCKQVGVAVLDTGEKLQCDLCLVGVGARPNLGLFQGDLDMLDDKPGGVKVDGHMKTSQPDVYAAGDIAAFPLKRSGGSLTRMEHVSHARLSAAVAMAEMLKPGSTHEYDYLPYFYSRIFDLHWEFYGSLEGSTVFFGDKKAKKFGTYWVKDGKVVGVFLEGGSPEEVEAIKSLSLEQPAAPKDLGQEMPRMMMQQPNQYFEQLGADKDLGNRALILPPAPDVKHLPPDHLSPAAPCSLVEELHSCPPPLSQVFGQAIEISALGHWPSAPRNWEDFVSSGCQA
ncbi:hypothetical protein WJX84_001392 [Apatococcus fuscideae]|uniref:monodehydroascorbate reductase (NADH) n=1 Tax=Apatococcus fuscideae TaxID=2026836 RepID=A0AAW1SBU2_9CHLO